MTEAQLETLVEWCDRADSGPFNPRPTVSKHPKRAQAYQLGYYDGLANAIELLTGQDWATFLPRTTLRPR